MQIDEDRVAGALELIGTSLDRMANLMAARYEKDFPVKREVRDAEVSHTKTEDEALREAQGASDETTEEWASLGRRETALVEREARQAARRKT